MIWSTISAFRFRPPAGAGAGAGATTTAAQGGAPDSYCVSSGIITMSVSLTIAPISQSFNPARILPRQGNVREGNLGSGGARKQGCGMGGRAHVGE